MYNTIKHLCVVVFSTVVCLTFLSIAVLCTSLLFSDRESYSYSTESTSYPLVLALHDTRLTIIVADPSQLPLRRFSLQFGSYLHAIGDKPLSGGSFPILELNRPFWSNSLGIYLGRSPNVGPLNPTYRLQLPAWVFCLGFVVSAFVIRKVVDPRRVRRAVACPTCGYDLRGSVESAVCPECGTPITPERRERLRAAGVTTETGVTGAAGGGRLEVDEHDVRR